MLNVYEVSLHTEGVGLNLQVSVSLCAGFFSVLYFFSVCFALY
jgi:hypothetical protein